MRSIVFNQLADGMEIKGVVPWKHPAKFWRDADDAQLISYIDSNYGTFSERNYRIAVTKVSDDRSYHPIKEMFESLPPWDGIKRAETILIDYLGADDNDYIRAVTRKDLCAAYMRVYNPGIKFDTMIVLNGAQGIGKSTLISLLGMDWFSDSLTLSDMNDKTAAEKLQGYWILEIGELAGMKKADLDKVKAFISRQDDKYRASFGRRVTPHPRQCVFFGTTNSENGYLRDITGNRRFWNVKVNGDGKYKPWELDSKTIKQIWAEVVQIAESGEKLYLDPKLEAYAKQEQRKAMEHDEREGLVREYLEPLLVAYWYKHDFERIAERLESLHIPFSKLDTDTSIERWNKGVIPVALIHPASAGHGLNLQSGGSTLVWFGLTWSLELYQQTNARLYRQGQKNTVVIQHIIAKGTIDEQILKALQRKDKTQSDLIDAVKADLGGFLK